MYSKTSTSHRAAAGALLIILPNCSAASASYNLASLPRISKTLPNHCSRCTQSWPTQDCQPSSKDGPVQAPNWPAGAHLLTPFHCCFWPACFHQMCIFTPSPPPSGFATIEGSMFCFQFSCWLSCETHRHPHRPALDIGQSQFQISLIFKFSHLSSKFLSLFQRCCG